MKGDAHPFGASELGHSCERSQQGHARGPGPTVYRTHLFSIGEADSVNSNVSAPHALAGLQRSWRWRRWGAHRS